MPLLANIGDSFIYSLLPHVVAICVFVFAVFFIARLLMEKRQPSNTFAWLLVIVLVPYLGVPLFLLFGGRKLKKLMARKTRLFHNMLSAEVSAIPREIPGGATMQTINAAGGIRAVSGNSLKTLTTGEDAFAEFTAQIKNARASINIATFILGRDETGETIVRLLAQRAREGIKVRLLLDSVGCFFMRRKFVQPIIEAGGEVHFFMRVLALPFRSTTNLRNHRKVAIFDGRAAIVGGHNLALAYMGAAPSEKRWRDFGGVITGPAAFLVNEIFLSDWSFASGVPLEKLLASTGATNETIDVQTQPAPISRPRADNGLMQIVASGPDVKGDPLYEGILSMIQESRKEICVITPYFIPDEVLWRSLIVKARAGVRVTLLVPAKSNHPITDFARRNYLRELHKAGARVMFYEKGMLHSKAVIVDGRVGVFGSANFDLRSLFVNFEIGVFVYSENELRAMETWAEALLAECVEVRSEPKRRLPWLGSLVEDLCRLLAPLL